jgi:hypothetical protein
LPPLLQRQKVGNRNTDPGSLEKLEAMLPGLEGVGAGAALSVASVQFTREQDLPELAVAVCLGRAVLFLVFRSLLGPTSSADASRTTVTASRDPGPDPLWPVEEW